MQNRTKSGVNGEIELIEKAQGGDPSAFSKLFEEYYYTVYRFSFRWCAQKEDAEDITQEVFIKVAAKIGSFQQNSTFKVWLYRIVINTAHDYNRKKTRHRDKEASYQDNYIKTTNTPENPLLAEKLQAAIKDLPKKLREATLLVWFEGMSHKEASLILGCAETSVSGRIFQARKKLNLVLKGRI